MLINVIRVAPLNNSNIEQQEKKIETLASLKKNKKFNYLYAIEYE